MTENQDYEIIYDDPVKILKGRLKIARQALEEVESNNTIADLALEEGHITEEDREDFNSVKKKLWSVKVNQLEDSIREREPSLDEDEAVDIDIGGNDD